MNLLKRKEGDLPENDRPPSVDEWIFYPDDGTAILNLTLWDYADEGMGDNLFDRQDCFIIGYFWMNGSEQGYLYRENVILFSSFIDFFLSKSM